MNLLTEPWIPVIHKGTFRHIALKDLLCTEEDWQITSPRDDMELAALQLAVCLNQVVFPPEDTQELEKRIESPFTPEQYDAGAEKYADWFVLDHPQYPFMQTKGVIAKEVTPIQKLLIGMPEGNNHTLFNDAGEYKMLCPACTAILLFNQASNCPGFGGGFKASIRGNSPVTILVKRGPLRSTIWYNILPKNSLKSTFPQLNGADKPAWIERIQKNESVYHHRIGILRGLFWTPFHIEILWKSGNGRCGLCSAESDCFATGFTKEKFTFDLKGIWPHPHGAIKRKTDKGELTQSFFSFGDSAPCWTQLTGFLYDCGDKSEGSSPAAIVTQQRGIPGNLNLIIGGYQVNKASVLQRRHELISLSEGWVSNKENINSLINIALSVKKILRKKFYGFEKGSGTSGLQQKAETLFYRYTEEHIHRQLKTMDWEEFGAVRTDFTVRLKDIALEIFKEVTAPYRGDPKMIKHQVKSYKTLKIALNKIIKEMEVQSDREKE